MKRGLRSPSFTMSTKDTDGHIVGAQHAFAGRKRRPLRALRPRREAGRGVLGGKAGEKAALPAGRGPLRCPPWGRQLGDGGLGHTDGPGDGSQSGLAAVRPLMERPEGAWSGQCRAQPCVSRTQKYGERGHRDPQGQKEPQWQDGRVHGQPPAPWQGEAVPHVDRPTEAQGG